MWGPSRAKKGLDLCPEQGKALSLSLCLASAADLSRSFPIRRAFLDSPRDRSRGFLLRVTLYRNELEGSSRGL